MAEAADRDRDDQLAGVERDVMVASLLGITPDRLRTMRRLHDKRMSCGEPSRSDADGAPPTTARSERWLHVDRLDDDALCAALRRRKALACGPDQPAVTTRSAG